MQVVDRRLEELVIGEARVPAAVPDEGWKIVGLLS
jgi:hypothetical protein